MFRLNWCRIRCIFNCDWIWLIIIWFLICQRVTKVCATHLWPSQNHRTTSTLNQLLSSKERICTQFAPTCRVLNGHKRRFHHVHGGTAIAYKEEDSKNYGHIPESRKSNSLSLSLTHTHTHKHIDVCMRLVQTSKGRRRQQRAAVGCHANSVEISARIFLAAFRSKRPKFIVAAMLILWPHACPSSCN